jgi:hypothetical protein
VVVDGAIRIGFVDTIWAYVRIPPGCPGIHYVGEKERNIELIVSMGSVAALAKIRKERPGKSPYSATTAKPNKADPNRDEEFARGGVRKKLIIYCSTVLRFKRMCVPYS